MAEFLTTRGVSAELEEIIKNTNKHLVLISPYLQIDEHLKKHIERKAKSGVDVHIIYRGESEEEEWLNSIVSIRTSVCKDLHAKCYFNENEALLTSMNLYQYSERNNLEMGVLVSCKEDEKLYNDIVEEAKHISELSKPAHTPPARPTVEVPEQIVSAAVRVVRGILSGNSAQVDADTPTGVRRSVAPQNTQPTRRQRVEVPQSGFCIRCKTKIPVDPSSPYCNPHFRSWSRYKNSDYEENHCHTCGNKHTATMSKPVCLSCYRKYRNVLEFA